VSTLPPDLASWSGLLEALPVELALAIGPWLKRLSVAVGPLRRRVAGLTGDVDGFDGIGRCGNAEHMLASEWLLMDEVPMEFLRRAVQGELSYLQLARHEPVAGGRCIALFDAGPDQIGAPRLAQLALLIVLARRAESAGADFGWGLAQASEKILITGVSPREIEALLAGRSVRSVAPEDVRAWSEVLPRAPDELWWIGAPRGSSRGALEVAQRRMLPNVLRIETMDRLEPGARGVSVRLHSSASAGAVQEVDLALPAERKAVRLLRDPYGIVRGPLLRSGHAITGARDWLFSANGRRLFIATGDGSVLQFFIPNSPREQVPKPLCIETEDGETVVAVQFAKKRSFALVADSGGLHLRSRSGSTRFTLPVAWTPPPFDGELRACWHRRYQSTGCLFFLDGADTLYRLPYTQRGAQPAKMLGGVEVLLQVDGAFRCLERTPEGLREVASHDADSFYPLRTLDAQGSHRDGTLFVAYGPHCDLLTSAVEVAPGRWQVYSSKPTSKPDETCQVHVGSDVTVYGLVSADRQPYLVGLDGDGQTLVLFEAPEHGVPRSLRAIGAVTHVWCSPTHPRLGYATRNGDVAVLDVPSGEIRLQLSGPMP